MASDILLTILQCHSILLLPHVIVNGQGDIPKCKDNGSRFVGETCYRYNASPVTWHQAKSNCESNGMILAYVSSLNQSKEILRAHAVNVEVWIGASDEKKAGEYIWVASNEIAAELSQLRKTKELDNKSDCVSIFPTFYAHDAPCNLSYSYICMEKLCPYNLEVKVRNNENVTLSWQPGFIGIRPQTFNVKIEQLGTNISHVNNEVKFSGSLFRAVEYFIPGLSAKTDYKIHLDVINIDGIIKCKTLIITTKATEIQTRSVPSWLVCLLILVPLVSFAGIAGYIFYRKKANRTLILEPLNTYDSLAKDIYSNDNGLDKDLVYSAPIEMVESDKMDQVYEPMNSEPIYANSSDMNRIVPMKSSGNDGHSVYKNVYK